jgi:hypothetical protein
MKFTPTASQQPDFQKMNFDEQREYIHTAETLPRRLLSRSPYAIPAVLHILSEDPSEDVRIAVANNGNTSETTLHRMAVGKNPADLQYAVACNQNTQARSLVVLGGKNREVMVRHAVMEHPNTPEDLSRSLMEELRR